MMPTGNNAPSSSRDQPYSLGLIGYPLGHSLSPQIHTAALEALGMQGEYRLYPVPPRDEGWEALKDLIDGVRNRKITGLNVTIPHKSTVIPLLDALTQTASVIGAVNTIYLDGEQVIGDNTDASGFWRDVQSVLPVPDSKGLRESRAIILGAGGSARAVAYALLTRNYHLTIAARRRNQAIELQRHFPAYQDQITLVDLKHGLTEIDDNVLIVNTTPLGMHPQVDDSPWPLGLPFPGGSVFYDLVYNPRETRLIKQVKAAGLPGETGLGMLVEQAALAFERWTSMGAPRQVMMKAAEISLDQ